ncbi:hypothetical protein [Roseiflexus sp. RS-1]|jgi:hypothetical protein|uniref:hypothetical protein n=1 Tax=Roseiflexus sp. (strain RS-1) TaxID=357808 RepID=UPI0000D806B9|nr:hypothetical protein [Roseiflexus sp. RS-1]
MIKQQRELIVAPRYAWLRRVALSLAFAIAAGLLVFIVARGISGALLFIEHQELVRSAAAALRNGIEGLPTADLRAARLRAEQSAETHMRIGLALAFIVAAITAAGSYLWQEQRAVQNER